MPPGPTALEAARIAHGRLATAPSRQALNRQYRPRPDLAPEADVMQAAAGVLTRSTTERCRVAVDAAWALPPRDTTASPEEAATMRAQLILLVEHDVLVRDYVLCRAVSDPDFDALVDAVVTTALRAPERHRAPIAAAAALLAVQGDNPVAAWALLALAEDESLAGLVRDALQFGLPPDELREVFAGALDAVVQRINAAS